MMRSLCGHLTTRKTRAAFFSDPTHRLRFVYTPKHSSWLNQISIWFSILVWRLLSRLSCTSVQELRAHILAFIAYYNRTSNGAFHWTYKGPRPKTPVLFLRGCTRVVCCSIILISLSMLLSKLWMQRSTSRPSAQADDCATSIA